MSQSILSTIKDGWILLRLIAVVSSSITTIVSTMLPIYLYYTFSEEKLLTIFLVLLFGAFLIHGVLTHILNDYTDHKSGTDENSPAILSGGSRVIQNGILSASTLWVIGKWLMCIIGTLILALFLFDYWEIAILLAVGLWSAVTYSLPPFRFSYRPFIGEWLSTFPSVLALGLGGAWLMFSTIPVWAWQNAVINALFCIAWVMVHHVPDRHADAGATPRKETSVVWASEKFGQAFSRLPALLYFSLTALCAVWLGTERIWGAVGMLALTGTAIFLVLKMQVDDDEQVSAYEKIILMLAMINGLWIGLFI
ncbi:prenyltransferase [Virgibacillus kekensis]|uniref:Prenyltransferase n=1 Tax=Virgibacillus kekensis TaxID=202261 RepID=A0ABV9DMX2_9BACI